jgi:ABC-type dipeptide/oligopeptide/nickel transport system permease component
MLYELSVKDGAGSSLVLWTTGASGLCVLASLALFNAMYYHAMTNRLPNWIGLIFASYLASVAIGLTLVVVSWRRGGRGVRILVAISGIVLMAIPVQLIGNATKVLWRWFLLG